MSPSDVAAFEVFGYVVLPGVLTAAECRSIAAEFTTAFQQAYPDLRSRRIPAWLPGLGAATPCSAALTADDGRLWTLAEQLLGSEALPVPPEVAWLRGVTPWHYDDPLGLRGVKFLGYVSGPSAGLQLLPMSHAPQPRTRVEEFMATSVGDGRPAGNPIEAVERDLVPSVSVPVTPGDLVAIDLHVWHCYRVREARILWAPEYLVWPGDSAGVRSWDEKFAAVAAAGAIDGARPSWPVWRDWLRADPPAGRRRAIDLLRRAGAFHAGRDRR